MIQLLDEVTAQCRESTYAAIIPCCTAVTP